MKQEWQENADFLFECRHNGRPPSCFPFKDAHRLLWECTLGYIPRIGWHRFSYGGRQDDAFLQHKGLRFAELSVVGLFFTNRFAITRKDLPAEDDEKKHVSKAAFVKRISRYGQAVFGNDLTLRPFQQVDLSEGGVRRVYGYDVKKGVSRFMIIGARSTGGDNGTFDNWGSFLEPPSNQGGQSAA